MKTSREWLLHFRENRVRPRRIPWADRVELSDGERAAIASSVQKFQLGESSEGRHLIHYARGWSERAGDSDYLEAMRLFIGEEQRHARELARFMAANAIPRVERTWTDTVFRRLRNVLASLEISIAVLVTAEILAKIYYAALRRATRSRCLRAICERILDDERKHVEFQCEQLARLRAGRGQFLLLAGKAAQRLLFVGTTLVVWAGHRRALARGGFRCARFLWAAIVEFERDLATMDPRRHGSNSRVPAAVRGRLHGLPAALRPPYTVL